MVNLLKGGKKITKESDPIAMFNQVITVIDSNMRTIEKELNKVELIVPPLYTDTTRPKASDVKVGSMFFNTGTGIPNFSNGVNWVNAAGVVV